MKSNKLIKCIVGSMIILIASYFGAFKLTADKTTAKSTEQNANVPDSVDKLLSSTSKEFYIMTYQDWINLQTISKESDLLGYTFFISSNLTGADGNQMIYDLSSQDKFEGIGCEDFPFKGSLKTQMSNTIIKTNRPLFSYLSTQSDVQSLNLVIWDTGCLAKNLTTEKDNLTGVTTYDIKDIVISEEYGSNHQIKKVFSDGNTGLLFHNIINTDSKHSLTIKARKIDSSVIQNETHGLTFGRKIKTEGSGAEGAYLPIIAEGKNVGLIAGFIMGNVELVIDSNISVVSSGVSLTGTSNDGFVGGLVGYVEGSSTSKVKIHIANVDFLKAETKGKGTHGYLIGGARYTQMIGIEDDTTALISQLMAQAASGSSIQMKPSNELLQQENQMGGGAVSGPAITYDYRVNDVARPNIVSGPGMIVDPNATMGKVPTLDDLAKFKDKNKCIIISNPAISAGKAAGGLIGEADNVEISGFTKVLMNGGNIKTETGDVGGLFGKAKDIKYSVADNTTVLGVSMTGNVVGGFCGTLDVNTTTTLNQDSLINVQGCTINATSLAGGLVGRLQSSEEQTTEYRISNYVVSETNVIGVKDQTTFGGAIGENLRSGIIISGNIGDSSSEVLTTNLKSTSTNNVKIFGGVVGIDIGNTLYQNIDVDLKGNLTIIANGIYGGIVGQIKESTSGNKSCVISHVKVSGDVKNNTKNKTIRFGGIAGKVGAKIVMTLKNEIDLASLGGVKLTSKYFGTVIGEQSQALIVLQPTETEKGALDYSNLKTTKWADEIGTYGGIIRNRRVENEKDWLILVDGSILGKVTTNGKDYVLDHSLDLMRLAITLNTEGNFGLSCFPKKSVSDLLGASYQVTRDLDLSASGIYSINRNDVLDIATYFRGSFTGANSSRPVIKMNDVTTYTQGNIGLFSGIQGATVKNLTLEERTITFAKSGDSDSMVTGNAGGVAALAYGNIVIENIEVKVNISDFANKAEEYYGGLFGKYKSDAKEILTINTITANVQIESKDNEHYAGGVIGRMVIGNNNYDFITSGGVEHTLKNITVSGWIGLPTKVSGTNITTAPIGGLVAQIDDGTLFDLKNTKESTKTKANLLVEDITIKDFDIKSSAQMVGGFFGCSWKNTNVTINNVTITSKIEIDAQKSYVGGLLHTVYGRVALSNINYSSCELNLQVVNNKDYISGLLIGNGRYAYISVSGYTIKNMTGSVNDIKVLDELVGMNTGGDGNDFGGVLTINQRGLNQEYTTPYHSQVTNGALSSPKTRYYYDLDKILVDANKVSKNNVLDDPKKVMIWHLTTYANEAIRSYFYQYYEDYNAESTLDQLYKKGAIFRNELKKGNLDLSTVSYYPTVIKSPNAYYGAPNGENVTIKFDSTTYNGNKWNANNSPLDLNQHKLMQGGLFKSATNATIQNITLQGKISSIASNSGALVNVSIGGRTSIKNITLDGITIGNFSKNGKSALLINKINSNAIVQISDIVTTGYASTDLDGDQDDDKDNNTVASALIRSVGGNDAVNITTNFTSINIDPDLFSKASFVFEYNFEADSTMTYNFTSDDYVSGNVTFGKEITSKTEYYNNDVVVGKNPNGEGKDEPDGFVAHTFPEDATKPYVLSAKSILVNFKGGHLLKGCGVYEDPYIIESVNQLMAVFYCVNGRFNAISNDWMYNEKKEDVEISDGTINSYNTLIYSDLADDASKKKLSKRLSNAYYQIEKSIDLNMMTDFNGFGSINQPFTGVIIGKKSGDEPIVITLPDKKQSDKPNQYQDIDTFGFIRYAKGTVLKDLTIAYPKMTEDSNTKIIQTDNRINVTKCTGAIANILGGDNVIDNVTVTGAIKIEIDNKNESNKKSAVYAGGYVGEITKGGLIIRNMKVDSLSEIRFYDGEKVIIENQDTKTSDYPYVCAAVGKVDNGYLIYDSPLKDGSNQALILQNGEGSIGYNKYLTLSRSFQIINGNEFIKRADGENIEDKKSQLLKLTLNSETNLPLIEIPNTQSLLVFSLAYNNGSLWFQTGANGKILAYNENARCRWGNYNNVGLKTELDGDNDFKQATLYEDKIGSGEDFRPYLSQFMASDSARHFGDPENLSGMNVELTGVNQLYDMAQYENSFRGIGCRYTRTEKMSSSTRFIFDGNFDGGGNTIQLDMIVDFVLASEAQDEKLVLCREDAALFNYMKVSNGRTIQNLTITGRVISTDEMAVRSIKGDMTVDDFKSQSDTKLAAGLVANLQGTSSSHVVNFDKITVSGLTLQCSGAVGGIVGQLDTSAKFNDCDITASSNTFTSYSNAGGFFGISGYNNANNAADFKNNIRVSFDHCNYTHLNLFTKAITVDRNHASYMGGFGGKIDANEVSVTTDSNIASGINSTFTVSDSVGNASCYLGGLFGYVKGPKRIVNTKINGLTLELNDKDSNKVASSCFGGLIGSSTSDTEIKDCGIDNMTANNNRGSVIHGFSGGLIGRQYGGIVRIVGTKVSQSNVKNMLSAGGLIGEAQVPNTVANFKITIMNAEVKECIINGDEYAGGFIGNCVPRQLVVATSNSYGNNANEIKNNKISSNQYAGGVIGKLDTVNFTAGTEGRISDVHVNENVIVSGALSDRDCFVGGIAGLINSTSSVTSLDHLTLSENLIASVSKDGSKIGNSGGISGKIDCSGASGQVIQGYEIELNNNRIGLLQNNKMLGTLEDGWVPSDIDQNVGLYNMSTKEIQTDLSFQTEVAMYPYCNYTGVFFGSYTGVAPTLVELLNVSVSQTSQTSCYLPVVDVGRSLELPVPQNKEEMHTYSSQIHIVYKNKQEIYNETFNEFPTTIVEEGEKISTGVIPTIVSNRPDENLDARLVYHYPDMMNQLLPKTLWDLDRGYVINKKISDKSLPIIVYNSSVEGVGELDPLIKNYIKLVTNWGGDYSSDHVTVECKNVMVTQGGSIQLVEESNTSINFEEGKFVQKREDINDVNEFTFTMICIRYQWSSNVTDAGGDKFHAPNSGTQYFYLPVIVEPILKIEGYMTLMEGISVLPGQMIESHLNATTVPNGSSYTLYTEYNYNDVRENFSAQVVDYSLMFEGDDSTVAISPGLRLTLIDLSNGYQRYHYEVSKTIGIGDSGLYRINFSDFIDDGGEQYPLVSPNNQKTMSEYKEAISLRHTLLEKGEGFKEGETEDDYGTAAFMIIVDTGNVDSPKDKQYKVNIEPILMEQNQGETIQESTKKFIYTSHNEITTTETKGFEFDLLEDSSSVTGNIEEGQNLRVKFSSSISATVPFWASIESGLDINFIEYEVVLKREVTDNKYEAVSFPASTKVMVVKGGVASEGKVIDGKRTNLYYFKDVDPDNNLSSLKHIASLSNTLTKTVGLELLFDFSNADFEGFEEGNYIIDVNLIQTMDKDRPSSTDTKDTCRFAVNVKSKDVLGFAVSPTDINQLGINLLEESASNEISFDAKFDFNKLKKLGTNKDQWSDAASNIYAMEFKVYKKTSDGYVEVPADSGITIKRSDGTSLPPVYNYGASQLEAGEGVITERFKVDWLVEKIESTNYKIVVNLKLKVGEDQFTEVASDFFIFTVAKLKVD